MKTSSLLSMTFLLGNCFVASAQVDQEKPVKRLAVNEFCILPAFLRLQQTLATPAEFKALAPNSQLLKQGLTDLSSSSNVIYAPNGSLSILLGVKFANKDKTDYRKGPSLRIGITCMSTTLLTGGLYGRSNGGVDTLVSAQSGATLYVDSLTSKYYDMVTNARQLRLDCSLIFRTNPDMRWSLFAGIGIIGGYSINATTRIDYTERKWIQYRSADEYQSSFDYFPTPHSFGAYSSLAEEVRNKNSFSTSAYIPIGIDFRIGKKRTLWKMTHIFYEMRPGVNFTFLPALRTFASTSMQHGLGLKMVW
jgi:hypothetical protein